MFRKISPIKLNFSTMPLSPDVPSYRPFPLSGAWSAQLATELRLNRNPPSSLATCIFDSVPLPPPSLNYLSAFDSTCFRRPVRITNFSSAALCATVRTIPLHTTAGQIPAQVTQRASSLEHNNHCSHSDSPHRLQHPYGTIIEAVNSLAGNDSFRCSIVCGTRTELEDHKRKLFTGARRNPSSPHSGRFQGI